LRRVKDDPARVLAPESIQQACRQARHVWRERTLDPVTTVMSMLVQALHGNVAIAHLVRLMHAGFSESAFCQARQRLPRDVLRALLSGLCGQVRSLLDNPATPGSWKGRRTLLVDGSGFSMPDTAELAAYFGFGPGQKPGCGFPLGHLVALFDAATGLLLDITTAPGRSGDLTMAALIRTFLHSGDILVGDRGFCSFAHIAVLRTLGVDGVFRLHRRREDLLPVRRRHRRRHPNGNLREGAVLVRRISPDDQIVEWMRPYQLAAWLTRAQQRLLPRFMQVRVIRLKVDRRGWRTRSIVLATTLIDPVTYPAAEIAELYLARWSIEVNFRHLKRTMGMNVLRCKSVAGVEKEVTTLALAYNLVRLVMLQAAIAQGVPPDRISFADALRWLQTAGDDEEIPTLKINPKRQDRCEPRAIKRRASRAYPVLTRSRAEARAYLSAPPKRLN